MKILKVSKILSKKFYLNKNLLFKMVSLRKLFPRYTKYSDYKAYVTQIKDDGHTKDILSVGFPIALTNTSGTSGEPKNFPV